MNTSSNTSLIITSIASPNAAMKAFAEGCKKNNVEFIVIGDAKSPKNFHLDGCRFVSLEEQQSLPFKLAKLLPENHYSRKNLGYLLSKDKMVIRETDDDNIPMESFWEFGPADVDVIDEKGWVNVYEFFTKKIIWPRGFPPEEIKNFHIRHLITRRAPKTRVREGRIVQSLADANPDVDALYRLTSHLPFYFDKTDKRIVLANGSWCPFNSQNTIWFNDAFPLMYLPSYCSFRMTDIWRSFIAQRIGWECEWNVIFEPPTVIQERNEHDLVKDFEDEISGYLNNKKMCRMLEGLDLKSGKENILENLIRCYKLMIENSWIGKEEMKLLEAWCEEF